MTGPSQCIDDDLHEAVSVAALGAADEAPDQTWPSAHNAAAIERRHVDELRPLTEREFRFFQEFVYERAGIHLAPTKRALLNGRLARRIRELGLRTFGAYYDVMVKSGDEQIQCLDRITTNETSFFREPRHFAYLQTSLIPALARARSGGCIRVWSAGCSTGEEPYSVAMLLREGLDPSWTIEITATDLSTAALARAAEGQWPMTRAEQIPKHFLRKYMLRGIGPQAGYFKAGPELRSMIRFGRLNLHQELSAVTATFDLIFCRNVMIYFDKQSKDRVVEGLIDRLVPGGHLFVGHAESLAGVTSRVRCVEPTIYVLADTRTPS